MRVPPPPLHFSFLCPEHRSHRDGCHDLLPQEGVDSVPANCDSGVFSACTYRPCARLSGRLTTSPALG